MFSLGNFVVILSGNRPIQKLWLSVLVSISGLICVAAPPSEAAWREIKTPLADFGSVAVADSNCWLITSPGNGPAFVTRDGGDNWYQVNFPGYDRVIDSVGTEGRSFNVVAQTQFGSTARQHLFKVDASGEVTGLGAESVGDIRGRNVATDEHGTTWIATAGSLPNKFNLIQIDRSGMTTTFQLPPSPDVREWQAVSTLRGLRVIRWNSNGPVPGTYRLDATGSIVTAEEQPIDFESENIAFSGSENLMSWDGGEHWAFSEQQFIPFIPRAPRSGVPRFMIGPTGIASQYSSFLFRSSGLRTPAGMPTNYLVDAGDAFVGWDSMSLFVHSTTLPELPTSIGDIPPDATRIISRANVFRSDAGLPPLSADALVSRAARNHSEYSVNFPEDSHWEMLGRPGFTGYEMSNRCEAVGTSCRGEVMYGDGEDDPSGGWLATVYHRPLLGAPQSGTVGAGKVPGGSSVMDYQSGQNILIQPFGYPNGRWRGEPRFYGETPNPLDVCEESGQHVPIPHGIAVSLYIPGDAFTSEVLSIAVRKQGTSEPFKGCLLNDSGPEGNPVSHFIMNKLLVPGTTYEVHARWTPGNDFLSGDDPTEKPVLTHDWSFYYEPDGYPGNEWSNRQEGSTARARVGKVQIKGPKKPRRNKKVIYRVRISNAGNQAARGVRLMVYGRGFKAKKKVGTIPVGSSKTSKVSLRFRKSGDTTLRFRVISKNAGAKAVKKKITVTK